MEIGLVDWFNVDKGFGVINTVNDEEVFLHLSRWKGSIKYDGINKLPIVFNVNGKADKVKAFDCEYFDYNNAKHWEVLISTRNSFFTVFANRVRYNLLQVVLGVVGTNIENNTIIGYFKDAILSLEDEDIFDKEHWLYKAYNSLVSLKLKNDFLKVIYVRINRLNEVDQLRLWKENTLLGYIPELNIFKKNSKEINVNDLKRIKGNEEYLNLIVINKIKDLENSFNLDDFLSYDEILKLIKAEGLKVKFLNDLNKIASINYIPFLKKEFELLTKKENCEIEKIEELYSNQPIFLNSLIKKGLKEVMIEQVLENCSFGLVIKCRGINIIDNINDYLFANIDQGNKEELQLLLESDKIENRLIEKAFGRLITIEEYSIVFKVSKRISSVLFEKYDRLINQIVSEDEYFDYWKQNLGEITPVNSLKAYLSYQTENYLDFKNWINKGLISKVEAKDVLFSIIKEKSDITNRYSFYTLFNVVKTICGLDEAYIELLSGFQNSTISLILWHFKKVDYFDFETLKGKFIYFYPLDQVYIFKRLFYLKHKGIIDFDLKKLDEILRADLDLYLTNEKFNNDFVLDISTHIIIECLKSYVEKGNFIFESDFILKDLKNNSNKRFKIEHYFDKCEGRLTGDYNWNTEGKVSQVFYGEGQFYYAIEFEAGRQVESRGYYGANTYFESNPNFQHLKEEVRKIPNRKWNPELMHWGVPSTNKEEVYKFAKENNFFIKLTDNRHYDNNAHLVSFTRQTKEKRGVTPVENIPNGIVYCEGRKANKKHSKYNKEFWWCCNQECFGNSCQNNLEIENQSNSNDKDIWEAYTLLDILHVLKINVDDNNGIDLIPDGDYFNFLGHINAFNRLLDKLYCEECENILYPKNAAHFGLYRDLRFYCVEDSCSKKHKEVYLNNCLYGECKTIIDSRVSKRCEHGLYICPSCGTCCSENLFSKRLDNLQKVGGYIHPDLIDNVKNKRGHLEKKEYYCYKCAGMMTEKNNDIVICLECNIEYDFTKFKWLSRKWINPKK